MAAEEELRDFMAEDGGMEKRHYNNGDAEFILETVSDAVVRVTHGEQTGYFGLRIDWDPARPYVRVQYRTKASVIM